MRSWRAGARMLIKRKPIALTAGLGAALVALAALALGMGQLSYAHPGPAIALFGLACAILIIGLVLQSLQSEAADQTPQIVGLELLVDRWPRADQRLSPRNSGALFEQIQLVLAVARLNFAGAARITFQKVFPGTKIERGAFLIQVGANPPLVLKLDRPDNLSAELANYQTYAAQTLSQTPGEPKVRRGQGRIRNTQCGAITYNLIGAANAGQLQPLSEYILTHNGPAIQAALTHIFAAINPWWATAIPPAANSLYAEYERLSRKRNTIEGTLHEVGRRLKLRALQEITANEPLITLCDSLRLVNPLNWIRDVFEASRLEPWASDANQWRASIVHGDFHTGNILLSEDQPGVLRAWLIDFPHTHSGPTVQDLARLEADITFGLLPVEHLDCQALYSLETALLLPSAQHPPPSTALLLDQTMPPDPQFAKGWQVIARLRTEAQRYLFAHDARPYYLALLHATLPTLYFHDRSDQQKLYAFISAALLCERLAQ